MHACMHACMYSASQRERERERERERDRQRQTESGRESARLANGRGPVSKCVKAFTQTHKVGLHAGDEERSNRGVGDARILRPWFRDILFHRMEPHDFQNLYQFPVGSFPQGPGWMRPLKSA